MFDLGKAFQELTTKLQGWLETIITLLPNLAIAVFIVVAFTVGARAARRLAANLFQRVSGNLTINRLIGSIVYLAVLATGTFIALTVLNLDRALLSILAGLGIVSLALSFAFQDMAANIFSGIVLALQSPFDVGDLVQTNDYFGQVAHIYLRTTVISTAQGQDVIIPNKEVFQKPFVNYSKQGRRRIDLTVGVSYGDDLELVRRTTLAAVSAVSGVRKDLPPELFFQEFGESSINLSVRFWIDFDKNDGAYQLARSEAITLIKRAYDEAGVTIPFPIRTLDFGIKGGERLRDVLAARRA